MSKDTFLTDTLNDSLINRRSFLKWSAAVGGTAALASGLNVGLKKIEGAAAASEEQTLTVGCYHNCGGRCILGAKVKDGTITRLIPDPTEEDTIEVPKAIPCLRGRAQTRRVYAPNGSNTP